MTTHRNLGKAYYENDEFDKAIEEFQKCLALAPNSAPDRINLGLTYLRAKRYEEAIKELEEAERLDPGYLHIYYDLGIIYKRLRDFQRAAEYLEKVKDKDPTSAATRYNLGDVYKKMGDDEKALAEFREAARLDPDHVSAHYQLLMYAKKAGRREEAEREAEIFSRLKRLTADAERTPEALERSKYSYIIDISPIISPPAKAELIGWIRFKDVTSRSKLKRVVREIAPRIPVEKPIKASAYSPDLAKEHWVPQVGGGVVFGDYDNDGWLDVYIINCDSDETHSANILYRHNGDGTFTDVTAEAGVGDAGMGTDAAFGDYDNDGFPDLYVVNFGPNVLYHNNGDGTFTDVSVAAGVDEPQFGQKAVWVDYDHDNDLDIFLANYCELYHPPQEEEFSFPFDFEGQINALLRNNGDGTFDDLTDKAGLLIDISQSRDVFISDFDDDNAIDIYLVNENGPNILFSNLRGGEFERGGSFDKSPKGGCLHAREGDFNNDGYPDILLVTRGECFVYQNDGQANFKILPMPELTKTLDGTPGPIEVLDFNNDGLPDILVVGTDQRTLFLFINEGQGAFRWVSKIFDVEEEKLKGITSVTTGDYDGDGDMDILALLEGGNPLLLDNQGGNAKNWVDVQAEGVKVNRSGIGSKVEIKAGPYYERKTVSAQPIHFGLGDIEVVDVIRITWPNGVVQNVVNSPSNQLVRIREKVRVSASCAFLYAYNGRKFVFINEILGIGPLGVPMAEGVYHIPDCDEFMKIEGHQLR
ncbi:MAG: FG-GAP-like repeat-containing protein, partial [bacterium]